MDVFIVIKFGFAYNMSSCNSILSSPVISHSISARILLIISMYMLHQGKSQIIFFLQLCLIIIYWTIFG